MDLRSEILPPVASVMKPNIYISPYKTIQYDVTVYFQFPLCWNRLTPPTTLEVTIFFHRFAPGVSPLRVSWSPQETYFSKLREGEAVAVVQVQMCWGGK